MLYGGTVGHILGVGIVLGLRATGNLSIVVKHQLALGQPMQPSACNRIAALTHPAVRSHARGYRTDEVSSL